MCVLFDCPDVHDGDLVEFPIRSLTKVGEARLHGGMVWARTVEGIEHGPLVKWRLVERDAARQ